MTPYSQDLRQRIIDTALRGDSTIGQIAEQFLVNVSFVTRLLQLYRSTGSVEPRPHGRGNPAMLTPEDLERLCELIRKQSDATLEECRAHLGASRSIMTSSHALSRLELPRKKKVPHAQEQHRPEVQKRRHEFHDRLAGVDPRCLIFVDECGTNTAMTRTYGRAPARQRIHTDTPGHWESISLIRRLRLSGVTATLAFSGATNTDVFDTYVSEVLAPELKAGDVVI